jgi:hypothetical protein
MILEEKSTLSNILFQIVILYFIAEEIVLKIYIYI